MKICLSIAMVVSLFGASSCCLLPDMIIFPKPTLPAATTSGKNTMGFLLNGDVWLPYNGFSEYPAWTSSYSTANGFHLDATNTNSAITFSISPHVITNHPYDLTDSAKTAVTFHFNSSNLCTYTSKNIVKGTIILTRLDSITGIRSGEFRITLFCEQCRWDTIRIGAGRFDLRD